MFTPQTSECQTYRAQIAIVPIMAVLVWLVLYANTFVDLWGRWTYWSNEMGHGLPVMVLFLYLFWRDFDSAHPHRSPQNPSARGLALGFLALCSLLWYFSVLINIQIVEQLLLIPLLTLILVAMVGWRVVVVHRLLLLFPLFAMPIWGSFNPVLLELASGVVGASVRAMEMPALIQGNSIYLPYGHILIADGCSGVRYFVIALTLGYLIGYLNGYKEVRIAILLMCAAVLGLLTNWIRIFVLILIGYHTEMKSGLMEDHELFGWLLFSCLILPAIYFAPHGTHKTTKPSNDATPGRVVRQNYGLWILVAAALGPIGLWVFGGQFDQNPPKIAAIEGGQPVLDIPVPVRAPQGGEATIVRFPTAVLLREDHYYRRHLEEKLVPYVPRLYDHQEWLVKYQKRLEIEGVELTHTLFQQKAGQRTVAQIQWFMVGNRVAASVAQAKWLQIPAVLEGEQLFSIVTLQASCDRSDCSRQLGELENAARQRLNLRNP